MPDRPPVIVQPEGHILLGPFTDDKPFGTQLHQAEALTLALELIVSVQKSLDRNQIGTGRYNDSEQILARQNAPLGRAVKALLDMNFEGVHEAWLKS